MKVIAVFLFSMSFIWCCISNHPKEELKALNLENSIKNRTLIKLSNIVNDIDYIVLDNSVNGLLASIQKIVKLPVGILVLDGSNTNPGLFLFDNKGKFIRKIGGIGRGPGEYIKVTDFSVDIKNKTIYSLVSNQKKLLLYDLDGNYIGIGLSAGNNVSISSFNNKFYFHYPSNFSYNKKNIELQLTIKDKRDSIIGKYHPMDENQINYLNPFIERASFSTTNTNIFYHVSKEKIVYRITNDSLEPYITLNLGKFALPDNFMWSFENVQKVKSLDKVVINRIQLNDNLGFVSYQRMNKKGLIFFKNLKLYNVGNEDNSGFIDDLDGLGYFSDFFVQDSILIQAIEPSSLLEMRNSYNISKRIKLLKDSLNVNDNYILRIANLKK